MDLRDLMLVDVLAVDPGIRSPGAALFRQGRLVAAARITFPIDTSQNDGERCLVAAKAVLSWVTRNSPAPSAVAFEWPQVYKQDTMSRANSIIPMAGVGMAIAGWIAAAVNSRVRVLTWVPGDIWGQLPKHKTGSALQSPRGQRVWSRLDADERKAVLDQHDALDSVGIGLHSLGRLGVRRAFQT
jgi:hypothetical protein